MNLLRRLGAVRASALVPRRAPSALVLRRRGFATPVDATAAATTPAPEVATSVQYWNDLYPVKLGRFDISSHFVTTSSAKLTDRVARRLPRALRDAGVRVVSAEARVKDGGGFVTLEYPTAAFDESTLLREINAKLADQGFMNKPSVFHRFGSAAAYPVRGIVFNEDIASLTPSTRLKVEASGDLSLETVYATYRPYGEISDIKLLTPKSAQIQFKHLRSAAGARNCTYRLAVADNGTPIVVKSSYEKLLKTHKILDWMSAHPRIVLPALVAVLVAVSVAIFDPIHVYMIESKVLGRFLITGWLPDWLIVYLPRGVMSVFDKSWSTLRTAVGNVAFGAASAPVKAVPLHDDDEDEEGDVSKTNANGVDLEMYPLGVELDDFNGGDAEVPRLRSSMFERPDSLVVIAGPAGVGKSEFANTVTTFPDHAHLNGTTGTAPRLVIDCDAFVHRTHTDADVIRILARQLGYWPVFHSLNKLWSYLDMAVAATTGAKAGISVTDETMVKHMLECASQALAKVAKDRDPASPYPIVVLDNFLKDKPGRSFAAYYDLLAQWAGFLVEAGVAHVVVVASSGQRGGGEVGVLQALGRALPTKTVEVVTLTDMAPAQAHRYLRLRIAAEKGTAVAGTKISRDDSARIVAAVGGRASDLELVVHKLVDGRPVDAALDEMVQKALLELQKHGMHAAGWTPAQFWYVVRQLEAAGAVSTPSASAAAAPTPAVSFDKVRFSTLFAGNAAPLHDMERAELVALQYANGRAVSVRVNKPLYATAMHRLLADAKFAAAMDVVMYKDLCKVENAKIRTLEDEYARLAEATGRMAAARRSPDKAIDERLTYLAGQIAASQKKVGDWYGKLVAAKSAL
ncbi:mitochondrial escape protein 2 [Blastocladiella emersonii ATCC 22665]|nr:mitochondrial escape protein 2 [Blastocladiella emersonii ATCC 22665]